MLNENSIIVLLSGDVVVIGRFCNNCCS